MGGAEEGGGVGLDQHVFEIDHGYTASHSGAVM